MTAAALLLYVAGLAGAFGLRTWLHVRRIRSSGFHGISGPPGSLSWWAGALFVLALALGLAAPMLALTDVAPVPGGAVAGVVAVAGLVLLVLGIAAVLVAQSGMGASWRIGVDAAERTDLVTGGVFAVVRNPIFTAMVVAQTGLTLAVPTVVSVAALGCFVLAVQLQAGPGCRGAVPAPAPWRRLLRLRGPHRPVPSRDGPAAPRRSPRARIAFRRASPRPRSSGGRAVSCRRQERDHDLAAQPAVSIWSRRPVARS